MHIDIQGEAGMPVIHIYVPENVYQSLLKRAESEGFSRVSAYVRYKIEGIVEPEDDSPFL